VKDECTGRHLLFTERKMSKGRCVPVGLITQRKSLQWSAS
jgi:hypothetical protein